jgi:predicted MPP superfamily phosphohydrolase
MVEDIRSLVEALDIDFAILVPQLILGICVLFVIFLVITDIRDLNRFVIREYYFCAKEFLKNAKVLLIADLHNKQYGRHNQTLLKAIESVNPDFILIAGDMITSYRRKNNAAAINLLRTLSAKYPVYYGYGNHERYIMDNSEEFGEIASEYEQKVGDLPLWRLRNESVHVPELNMNVYGLDLDRSCYKRKRSKEFTVDVMTEVLGEVPLDEVNILIAHNPEYFYKYAEWGADLVVAGHLHGGIIRLQFIGGMLSPRFTFFPRYDGGLYTIGKSTMIVSRGLGMHTLPLRLFNPGELVVINMRH